MQSKPRILIEYSDDKGRIPFRDWLQSLKDFRAQAIVDARLTRVRMGNFGSCRSVGQGVMELKIDIGPGYRVYFGQDGDKVVVLLVGGNKKTQSSDIKRAQEYWDDYTGA